MGDGFLTNDICEAGYIYVLYLWYQAPPEYFWKWACPHCTHKFWAYLKDYPKLSNTALVQYIIFKIIKSLLFCIHKVNKKDHEMEEVSLLAFCKIRLLQNNIDW